MFRATCDGRVVVTDTTLRIHSGPPRFSVTYDSFAARARMIPCGHTPRWIGEEDAGAGAPSRRRPTARERAVSIANALRTTRSTLPPDSHHPFCDPGDREDRDQPRRKKRNRD